MSDPTQGPIPEERHAAEERWTVLQGLDEWLRTPMIILSLVWLGLVIAELIWPGNEIFLVFGILIWIIFIAEFLLRLVIAPAKFEFLKNNLLTVIALILPAFRMLALFRALRFLRLVRGLRLVRIVSTANRGMNALRAGLGRTGLGYVFAATVLVALLGAAGMMAFENEAAGNQGFESYGEALWWTAMILTTMGSSYWPVTSEGRLLCLLLSIYAFTIFGYITAGFASFLIGHENRQQNAGSTAAELQALRDEVRELRSDFQAGSPGPG
jgi:voltage-gated potassium channel